MPMSTVAMDRRGRRKLSESVVSDVARCALEGDDGSVVRLDKIFAIMAECRFGIHDLSRTTLDSANRLPRFNMPLELGVFLGGQAFWKREAENQDVPDSGSRSASLSDLLF